MRQEKDKIIKTVFRALALKTRERLDLTQKEMADRLDMCERSYFDIEAGKTKCGTLTVLLLLMQRVILLHGDSGIEALRLQ